MTRTYADSDDGLSLMDIVYLGFNSRVVALHRDTGEILWDWKSPKGRSDHVAVLLDGDRIIASISEYTYCLDAMTGNQIWFNPLSGYGLGIPSLASVYSNSGSAGAAAIIAQEQQQHAAAATS